MPVSEIEQVEIKGGDWTFDCRVAGPEDGRLVVLLHGFPETSYSYRSQLAALADAGMRAVAPDQRGYSPGARPLEVGAYAIDHLGSDVIAIVDEIGAPRFDLVGHDWGAAVAWYVAGRWPGRVRTLTALSVAHPSAFSAALRGELGGNQAERSTYMDFFRQEGTAEDSLLPTLRDMYVGSGLGDEAADEYMRVLGDRSALTGGLNYYRANSLADGLDVPPIEVPTLHVWSTDDPFLGREAAEATASFVRGPYRFEVLEGVDHWVPEKAASEVNRLLLDHLAAHAD